MGFEGLRGKGELIHWCYDVCKQRLYRLINNVQGMSTILMLEMLKSSWLYNSFVPCNT